MDQTGLRVLRLVCEEEEIEMHRRVAKRFSAVFAMLCLLVACNRGADKIVGSVLESVNSPDSQLVATLTKSEHGATVSDVYRVYLSRAETDSVVAEVLRADRLDSVRIQWSDASRLTILMPCGRVFMFRNFFEAVSKGTGLSRTISVYLDTNGVCNE